MANRFLSLGIIGAGHFGRFHAIKASASKAMHLVGVYDPRPDRAEIVAQETGCQAFSDYADLLKQVQAVIIAAPARHHYSLGRQALEAGKHVLVEKPIAATLEEAKILADLAEKQNSVLQVGHLLRYSAEHRAITERITRPVYIEATRIAPFKPRGTDVSVILDLMIHDLDFVLSLVNSPIADIDALGAAVSSPHEDIANARVRFENGCVASITASRVSLKTERHMRIFAQNGYLSANFIKRELSFIYRHHAHHDGEAPKTHRKGLVLPGTEGFRREAIRWHDHDNLQAEHEAFLASCLDQAPVLVDARAGITALDAALRVHQKMQQSRQIMEYSGLVTP